MTTTEKITPKALRAAREAAGLSQGQAAALAGVSRASLLRWEAGHAAPVRAQEVFSELLQRYKQAAATVRIAPAELRAAREAAGLTQAQAAAYAGVGRDTLLKWEAGQASPPNAQAVFAALFEHYKQSPGAEKRAGLTRHARPELALGDLDWIRPDPESCAVRETDGGLVAGFDAPGGGQIELGEHEKPGGAVFVRLGILAMPRFATPERLAHIIAALGVPAKDRADVRDDVAALVTAGRDVFLRLRAAIAAAQGR